ncbi:phage/plasmid primase, P4 family [Mycoplasma seminis]|uniref:Phage/plasmid primase, P4 family n=1 Tax=Mycoplasma seminis TaxID=512749 RepID=A0ABY9HAR6_9MOLU|nr:phage/plasmid primase, P4 family [Mycoplasma seminis]WLP85275.1 phage/plasmid primase, P4 family [Mycoplasma seminis]
MEQAVDEVLKFYAKSNFLVLGENKAPLKSIKDKSNWKIFSNCKSENNLGIILENNYIVIDIDNKDDPQASERLIQLIKQERWIVNIMETDRGHHFWFKAPKEFKNEVDAMLPLGIRCDIKTSNNAYVVIKKNGQFRKWISFYGENIDTLPKELTPLSKENKYTNLKTPVNLQEGSRRDNLFNRIPFLVREGFNKELIKSVLYLINKYFFATPLPLNEVAGCFSNFDEFFNLKQQEWYDSKGRFLIDMFIAFCIKEFHITRYASQVYFYDTRKNIYVRDESRLMGLIYQLLPNLRIPKLNEIINNFRINPLVPDREPEKNIIALQDCLFDTLRYETKPFSPVYFVINKINVWYSNNRKNTEFINNFILDVCNGDEQLAMVLYEFVGYCLTYDLKFQKSLLIYGPTASNGKSTFLEVLQFFFNDENISNLSLEDYERRFKTSQLLDKMVNIGGDISTNHIQEPAEFKKAVTGDMMSTEFKGKDIFSFRNRAKNIFAANKLPSTSEKSDGFFRRFIIANFSNDFKGSKRDINILDKLLTSENMSALFSLALDGLKRLRQQQGFTFCEKSQNTLKNYSDSNNNIILFFKHSQLFKLGEFESGEAVINKNISDLYADYKNYCEEAGNKKTTLNNFKDEVLQLYKHLNLKVIKVEENGLQQLKFVVNQL